MHGRVGELGVEIGGGDASMPKIGWTNLPSCATRQNPKGTSPITKICELARPTGKSSHGCLHASMTL